MALRRLFSFFSLALSPILLSAGLVSGVSGEKSSFVNPVVTGIVASPAVINEATVGPGSFTITVTYDRDMVTDGSKDPLITFPVEDPTATITLSSVLWLDARNFEVTYDVVDVNEEISDIDITADGGEDLATGDPQIPGTQTDVFTIDTRQPTGVATVSNDPINILVLTQTVTIVFDEDMDTGVDPTINFNTSANFTSNSDGFWINPTTYSESFTHDATPEIIAAETVNVTNAQDVAGNTSVSTSTGAFLVETDPPSVLQIIRLDPSPTGAASVDFEVTFSEDVTNIGLSDFTVTTTGTANGSVTLTTGTNDVYVVTVGSISGDGTLTIDVLSAVSSITDLAGNPITADFTTGEQYVVCSSPPVITAQPMDFTACETDILTFTVSATGAGLTYTWEEDQGGGFNPLVDAGAYSGTSTSVLTITNVPIGFDGYKYRVIVGGTCPITETSNEVTLNVNFITGVNITASPPSVCENTNATISVTATGTNLSFAWEESQDNGTIWLPLSDGGVYSGTGTTDLMLTGVPSTYDGFKYRAVVSAPGCSDVLSTEVDLIVDLNPTAADAGPDQGVCLATATLDGNVPAIGTGMWSVILGPGTVDTPADPASGVSGLMEATPTVFRWTISNGACTPTIDDVTVSRASTVTPAMTGGDILTCRNFVDDLGGNIPVIGVGEWSLVAGTATFDDIFDPNSGARNLVEGNTFFRYTISSPGCTPSTEDITVTFDPTTVATLAVTDILVCNTRVDDLGGNAVTSGIGTWTVQGGSSAILDDPNDPNSGASNLDVGANVFRWTIDDGTMTCVSFDDVTVTNDPGITTATVGTNDQVCADSYPDLGGNAPDPTNETGIWSVALGSGVFADPNDPNTSVSGLSFGENRFRWTISKGVCNPSVAEIIIVRDEPPSVATIDVTTINTCETFVNGLTGNTPTVGNGFWSVVSGAGVFTDPNDPNTDVTAVEVGDNVYAWTISSGVCPQEVATMTVTRVQNSVEQLPPARVVDNINCVAENVSGQIDLQLDGRNEIEFDIQWYLGSGTTNPIAGETGRALTFRPAGIYTAEITDLISTCVGTKEAIIFDNLVFPEPAFGFVSVRLRDPVQFTDSSLIARGTIDEWDWDFGDGGTSTEQDPVYTYETDGLYTVSLTVTSDQGCASTTERELDASPDLPVTIYNVITPNGDGSNDFLNIENIDLYPESEIVLLDRWGVEVFSTTGYGNDFPGEGQRLPAGNYICIVKLNRTAAAPVTQMITVIR